MEGREMDVPDADGGIRLQQDIGDPHLGQAAIQVEHKSIGVLGRHAGRAADAQHAVLNGAAGDHAVASGSGEALQTLRQARLALGQPLPGLERNGQPGRCVCGFDWHQGALHIAITPGMREPDVP